MPGEIFGTTSNDTDQLMIQTLRWQNVLNTTGTGENLQSAAANLAKIEGFRCGSGSGQCEMMQDERRILQFHQYCDSNHEMLSRLKPL